ncbi:unnamed protein product [Amoebophrya sp. A120]|nr:unnamed protein product [Amoebophrya sp. A120]|eukprot:GSA120T00019857001.1
MSMTSTNITPMSTTSITTLTTRTQTIPQGQILRPIPMWTSTARKSTTTEQTTAKRSTHRSSSRRPRRLRRVEAVRDLLRDLRLQPLVHLCLVHRHKMELQEQE